MLTPEQQEQIQQIQIYSRHLVNNLFAGQYHANFKGIGIEFEEVREYQPGDDIRAIDWFVSARMNTPYVKRFVEERERSVMIVMDVSHSTVFGTQECSKREAAARLGAILAFSAITNNDRVGLLMFTDQIELHISPRKGRRHVLRLIRDMMVYKTHGTGTDINNALVHLKNTLKHHAIIFFISDFLVPDGCGQFPKQIMHSLNVINTRHDLITFQISDPLEKYWPDAGLVTIKDLESGKLATVDTSDADWRHAYERRVNDRSHYLETIFKRLKIDHLQLSNADDDIQTIAAFFRMRARRRRR